MEFTPAQRILFTKKKFTQAIEDLRTTYELGKALTPDASGLQSFLAREANVDKIFDSAVSHYEKLIELSVLEGVKDTPSESDKANYDTLQRWYYRIKEIATPYRSSPGHQSVQASTLMNSTMSSTRVRLPKLILPEFSGKFADWPFFRDTYQSLIHQEATLSNIEKFHYLVSRLKGPALDAIKSIAIVEGNYEQAWKTLIRIFDSKRRLASSYLQNLLSFPALKGKPTLASLSSFLNHVAESVSAFNTLKVPDPSEFILFELAIRGLDPVTREAFELAHTSTEFPTFSELVKFVEQRCAAFSMLVDYPEHPSPAQSTPVAKGKPLKPVSLFTNYLDKKESTEEPPTRSPLCCSLCSQSHRIKDCDAFNKLTLDERSTAVKSWKGCYNCLAPGHRSQQCRSPFCCQICRRRHHTLLHRAAQTPSTQESTQTTSAKTSAPSAKKSSPSGSALTGLASHAHQVLLGTAKALIHNSFGKLVEIRLVIDSGSQFSFITAECIKRLGLKPSPFEETIVGIGQSTLSSPLGRVTCKLASPSNPCSTISTNAVVVPTIAPLMPQTEIAAEIRTTILRSKTELADPTFWSPNPIDFLLGADLFGYILCPRQRSIPMGNQLYSLSTVFGSVIMGSLPQESPESIHSPSTASFFAHVKTDSKPVRTFNESKELSQPPNLTVIDSPDHTFYHDSLFWWLRFIVVFVLELVAIAAPAGDFTVGGMFIWLTSPANHDRLDVKSEIPTMCLLSNDPIHDETFIHLLLLYALFFFMVGGMLRPGV